MKKTEARKAFILRKDYYEKLLTTLPRITYITLSTLDLEELPIKDLEKQGRG